MKNNTIQYMSPHERKVVARLSYEKVNVIFYFKEERQNVKRIKNL